MNGSHFKYVLLGGGVSSGAAAAAIRQRDTAGSVLLVGQEVNRPYHRRPLSREYLLGSKGRGDLFTVADHWFTDHHIELCTGRRALRLDTNRRTIIFDNGQEVGFEKLLIATGGSPIRLKIPGIELPNVYYLRTMENADRLRNAVEKAGREGRPHERGRGRAGVIGGGFLGVELAGTLAQMGLDVALVEAGTQPCWGFTGETVGRMVVGHLENRGVQVHLQTVPLRLEGDGRVQRMALSTGSTVDVDLVAVAIGLTPNKDLLRGTAIVSESAILVDDHCRTNQDDIYAAGDCAAIFDPLFGRYRRVDHWEMAVLSGAIAGRNMAGADERYEQVSYYSIEMLDLKLSVWGEARQVQRRIVRGNTTVDSPDFVEIGVDGSGKISQVVAINHSGEDEVLGELVRRRLSVNEHDGLLRDPCRKLRDLLV